jgi:hypothetical protein
VGEEQIGAGIAAAAVATLGLWWFRLIMKNVREMPKTTRYGIYALVWLAYFTATMLVIAQSGATT